MELKVNEIFHSIQGESTHAGRPCTFVRLTACDLRCTWCDTEYAFYEGKPMALEHILEEVQRLGPAPRSDFRPLVEVTGGEPLLQKHTPDLCRLLHQSGYEVLVETGGHRDVAALPRETKVILDVKCPGSGESEKNLWSNLDVSPPGSEVKFVIADRRDFDWALKAVRERGIARQFPVLFSPVHGSLSYEALAEWILESGEPVRFQAQLHKQIWEPTRRGV